MAYRRLVLVFGALGDKDYGSMLRKMAPLTDRVILTGIRTDGARSPEILAKEAGRSLAGFDHVSGQKMR